MIFITERENFWDLIFWDVVCSKSVPRRGWWIQSSALPADNSSIYNQGEFEIVCSVYFLFFGNTFME